MKLMKIASVLGLAALGAWIGRLIAHSKVPLPEGKWREVSPEELGNR